MIDDDVIDDQDSFTSPATATRRRVPAYVAGPVVAACALLGYAISLAMPLRSAPGALVDKPPAAEIGHLDTSAANPPADGAATAAREAPGARLPADPGRQKSVEVPSNVAAAPSPTVQVPTPTLPDAPASKSPTPVGRSEPITVSSPAPTPVPVIRTGSVEQAQAPDEMAPSPTAAMPIAARAEPQAGAAEPSAGVKRDREARHKRIRRIYYRRRVPPPQPVGPAEALWSLMTK